MATATSLEESNTSQSNSGAAHRDYLIRCHRAILWSLYEYSLYRSTDLSRYLHSLLHQYRFECNKSSTTFLLRKTLPDRFWRGKYNSQLPLAITGTSRLKDMENRLYDLKKELFNWDKQSTSDVLADQYRGLPLPEGEMLTTVQMFICWLIANNDPNFMSKNLTIKVYSQVLQIKVLQQIVTRFDSTASLRSLQINVKRSLQLPPSFQKLYTLTKKMAIIKAKFEGILRTKSRLIAYVRENARIDLIRLCESTLKSTTALISHLHQFTSQCQPQIEIVLSQMSFVDTKQLCKELVDFIDQLRQSNQEGHLERLRLVAENSCFKMNRLLQQQLVNSSGAVHANNDDEEADVNIILDSCDETDELDMKSSASSINQLNSTGNFDNTNLTTQDFKVPLRFHLTQVIGGKAYKIYK